MTTSTLYTLTKMLRRVLLVRTSARVPARSSSVSAEAPYSPQLSSRMAPNRNSLSRKGRTAAAVQGREARARYRPVRAARWAAGRAKLPIRMPAPREGKWNFDRWGNSHFCSQRRSKSPAASKSAAQAHRAAKAG